MIIPSFLNKGDTVVIVSPAKAIDAKSIEETVSLLSSWGLKVEVGRHCLSTHHYFSGTDQQRQEDFQWALNHPHAKAIFCARGGYGVIRIVDSLDFQFFLKSPKWVIGFSDITVFHAKLNQIGVASIHGIVPLQVPNLDANCRSVVNLKSILFGTPTALFAPSVDEQVNGSAEGQLIGGNLAIVESLLGTSLSYSFKNKILFLEEVSEYAYKLDRMFWSLKKSGALNELVGVALGGFTDVKNVQETFGYGLPHLLMSHLKELHIPVGLHFPAGHQNDNEPMIFGAKYQLDVSKRGAQLTQISHGKA